MTDPYLQCHPESPNLVVLAGYVLPEGRTDRPSAYSETCRTVLLLLSSHRCLCRPTHRIVHLAKLEAKLSGVGRSIRRPILWVRTGHFRGRSERRLRGVTGPRRRRFRQHSAGCKRTRRLSYERVLCMRLEGFFSLVQRDRGEQPEMTSGSADRYLGPDAALLRVLQGSTAVRIPIWVPGSSSAAALIAGGEVQSREGPQRKQEEIGLAQLLASGPPAAGANVRSVNPSGCGRTPGRGGQAHSFPSERIAPLFGRQDPLDSRSLTFHRASLRQGPLAKESIESCAPLGGANYSGNRRGRSAIGSGGRRRRRGGDG